MLMVTREQIAREVHAAWCDRSVKIGDTDVPWEELDSSTRLMFESIAERVARLIAKAMGA